MYTYPIDFELYSKKEAIILIEFLSLIEDANERKVDKTLLSKKHKEFRSIINSVSTEKQLDREF